MDDEVVLIDVELFFEDEDEEDSPISLLFDEEEAGEDDTILLLFEEEAPPSGGASPYGGAYTVTPGEEAQTLATAGRVLDEDIVVRPIPEGYARISHNGSILTVW